MAIVLSTRCTYAPANGLPALPAGQRVTLPDALLAQALALRGVIQLAPAAVPAPAPFTSHDQVVIQEAVAEALAAEQAHPNAPA